MMKSSPHPFLNHHKAFRGAPHHHHHFWGVVDPFFSLAASIYPEPTVYLRYPVKVRNIYFYSWLHTLYPFFSNKIQQQTYTFPVDFRASTDPRTRSPRFQIESSRHPCFPVPGPGTGGHFSGAIATLCVWGQSIWFMVIYL